MERRTFQDVLGEFNEAEGMKQGLLYVPVSLVNIRDMRPYQFAIDENIRECRYFILVPGEDWGPPERNFRRAYQRALQYQNDTSMPMSDVICLAQKDSLPSRHPDLPAPTTTFSTTEEFKQLLLRQLSMWMDIYREEIGRTRSTTAARA